VNSRTFKHQTCFQVFQGVEFRRKKFKDFQGCMGTLPIGINVVEFWGTEWRIQKAWLVAKGEVWGGRYTSYRSRDLGRALGLSPEKKDIFSLEMARFGEF